VSHGDDERLFDTLHLHDCVCAACSIVGDVDDETLKQIVTVQLGQHCGGLRVIHVACLKMNPMVFEFHVKAPAVSSITAAARYRKSSAGTPSREKAAKLATNGAYGVV
jgi:hypothetical protein